MNVTGTHIHYFFNCKRQLWLFANGIQMEHTSDTVFEGKLLHETSYAQRSEKYKEVQIGSIKVDFYDFKKKIIHEIKKSSKMKDSHVWQLKYYILVFERAGIEEVSGILEYPKERSTEEIYLTNIDREFLEELEQKIDLLIHDENVPKVDFMPKCKRCSYCDFCWSGEVD